MKTKFICDSTLQISEEFIKNYPVSIVPLEVRLDDEIYEDNITITAETFYKKLNEGKKPSTSQPSVGKIHELYEKLKKTGATNIVVFCVSSKLSGTYSSFLQAKELIDGVDIQIVDTTQIARIAGASVEKIIKDFTDGKIAYENIEEEYLKLAKRQNILVTVENMDFLYAGGRLNKTQFLLSNLLNILPVITLKDGALAVSDKHRGLNKTLNKMCDEIKTKNPKSLIILYTSADLLEKAEAIVKKSFSDIPVEKYLVSPVIGTHAGPRALGIGYLEY